ncbi:MAG TPA: hypothetical protein VMS02_09655 [Solirubrobacteraceae bacterium]|nr:hypothetical protein [Solirubrobacteraceae bacterium]
MPQNTPQAPPPAADLLIAALEHHPHARAVLVPALPPAGAPSHAYLFHGPPGAGKRSVARAFAAALLVEDARVPETVAERVARDAHPDLTWAAPSGAGEMLVADVDGPVVAAATRTPFESRRRLFVIEDAHTMNDQAANRLLKTLEEPPAFAHLILLAPSPRDVLATIASRCQPVRFDAPPPERIAERLRRDFPAADPAQLAACARLALGDARLASRLAGESGVALRAAAERFVRCALRGENHERPWLELLALARADAAAATEAQAQRTTAELELLPARDRRRHEREAAEAQRRSERRVRTRTLAEGLRLAELWLRDLWCLALGVPEAVHAVDRLPELRHDADGRAPAVLGAAIERVRDTRLRLGLNVSEELALEALAYRLRS